MTRLSTFIIVGPFMGQNRMYWHEDKVWVRKEDATVYTLGDDVKTTFIFPENAEGIEPWRIH